VECESVSVAAREVQAEAAALGGLHLMGALFDGNDVLRVEWIHGIAYKLGYPLIVELVLRLEQRAVDAVLVE
jgi:hypothetical protein